MTAMITCSSSNQLFTYIRFMSISPSVKCRFLSICAIKKKLLSLNKAKILPSKYSKIIEPLHLSKSYWQIFPGSGAVAYSSPQPMQKGRLLSVNFEDILIGYSVFYAFVQAIQERDSWGE